MAFDVQAATRSSSTPARHLDSGSRENPFQSDPYALPREAGGRQKRLLGLWGIFLLLGPPASTWAVSVSLTGTRLRDRASHPKVLESFGWLQVPDIEGPQPGVCQKCARRTSPIVRTVSCRVGSKGEVTGRTTDGLP